MAVHVDICYDVFFDDLNALLSFSLFFSECKVFNYVFKRLDFRMHPFVRLNELPIQVVA